MSNPGFGLSCPQLHSFCISNFAFPYQNFISFFQLAEVTKSNGDLEKKVLELQNLLSTHLEKVKEQDLRIDVISRRVGTDKAYPPAIKVPNASTSIESEKQTAPQVVTEPQSSSNPQKRRSHRQQTERARKRLKK